MSTEPSQRARPAAPDFRIGDRLICPGLNRILTPEETLQVEPKVMQVLLCLVQRPGQVVTKEQLLREVWEGAFVTEDVLTRAVGELRRSFADDAARPRFIETIRKSGYRLIAPIDPAPSASAPAVPAARPSGAGGVALVAGALLAAAVTAGLLLVTRERAARSGPLRVKPITTLPGNERDPALSPDGTRVAFAWNGGSGEDYSLYVQLVDSGPPLRLTQRPGVEDRVPAWSPDGQRLAFTRSAAGDCRILTVSALGGAETSLAPCGDRDYRRVAWSPDSRWLAVTSREKGGPLGIELLSPDTLERRRLTSPSASILGDSSPAFSPDGGSIAFSRNVTDSVGDLYRVPVAGGEPTRLTFDNRDTMGLAWEHDGKSIVFSSSRAGIYSLWRVSGSGGEPTWVAGGGMKMKHPSTARTRNAVAYENWLYEVNLWRVSASGGSKAERLTEAADEWNFEPAISPDGARVAFVSTRSGSPELWVTGPAGGDPRKLTAFGAAQIETPSFSPDGARLVFSLRREARAELWTVDAGGGVPERLLADSSDAVAPSWSRDGASVYFASRRSGSWQVWKLRLTDPEPKQVTSSGGYAAKESRDGRFLFFTKADAPGIWRQGVGGAAPSLVVATLAPEDWANWDVSARGLYFREQCASHTDPFLAFLPFDSSKPVHLAALPDQGWSGFSVSPDEAWVVYPRVDRHTCDIRLIENAP